MAEVTVTQAPTEPVISSRAGTSWRAVSPAAHLADRFAAAEVTGPRAVALHEVPFATMVGVRAVPGSAAAQRIESSLGLQLPTVCGVVSSSDRGQVLWLSPDEFLVVSDESAADLTDEMAQALQGDPGSATDLSANRTTFELSGPSARAVLEKGCPLDLHPRAFPVGNAYLTTIGKVPVLLWQTDEQVYRILPRSSYADFLGRWLLDAMTEFAAPEIP